MSLVVLLSLVLINYTVADIRVSGSTMLVSRVTRLVCKSNVNLTRYPGRMVAYHQWNQVYNSKTDRVITNLGAIKALNTQLTIELERFDNNTDIYSSFSVHNASNAHQLVFILTIHCSGIKQAWINLQDDGFYKYQADKILKYDVRKQTTFSCQTYSANAQVGWINTTANKIFLANKIKSNLALTAAHNGSMVCCIYYTMNVDQNGWENIRRHVKGKTLLILEDRVPSIEEPRSSSTEIYYSTTEKVKHFKPTNEPGQNCHTTNELGNKTKNTIKPGQNSNSTTKPGQNFNATNEPGKNSNATHRLGENFNATNEADSNINTEKTDSSDQDSDTSSNSYLTIIISVSASVLVLLVVVCAVRQRYWRGTGARQRPQLPLPQEPSQRSPDELDPNSPFYLNLLFRKECELEIQAREEPQYEEVMYH